jgi:cytochrome b6-f complex iron-sulfur subunit
MTQTKQPLPGSSHTVEKETGKADNAPEKPRRRALLNWLWALFGLLACLELSWFTGSIIRSRRARSSSPKNKYLDAGLVDAFKPGDVKAIPEGLLYLVRLPDGGFLALSRTCTHLGCAVPWDEKQQQFICPCHGSKFDQTGSVITAPAIRPLDYFPVRIENGQIRIDTAVPLRREAFEPSQATKV